MIITIMALCFTLGAAIQGGAEEKVRSRSFAGVIPFVTSNDRVGFFDQNNGRFYMYDSDVAKCVFVGQIHSLGKPIEAILTNTGTSNI